MSLSAALGIAAIALWALAMVGTGIAFRTGRGATLIAGIVALAYLTFLASLYFLLRIPS